MGHQGHVTQIWKAEVKQPYCLCAQKNSADTKHSGSSHMLLICCLTLLACCSFSSHRILTSLQCEDWGKENGPSSSLRVLLCPCSLPLHIHLSSLIFFFLVTSRPSSDTEAVAIHNCIKLVLFDKSHILITSKTVFLWSILIVRNMVHTVYEKMHSAKGFLRLSHLILMATRIIAPIWNENTGLNKTHPMSHFWWVMKLELKPWEHDKRVPKVKCFAATFSHAP